MDVLSIILQGGPPVDPDTLTRTFGFQARGVGTLLGTLIVGGLLLVFAPEFIERVIDTIEEEPGPSFVYGIVLFVVLIVITFVLIITIIGILVAIPLLLVVAALYLVGSATVFVYVGERLLAAIDTDSSRWGHLLVGAIVAGVLAAIPGIGGLVNFVVNSIGVGAIVYRWRNY